MVSEQLRDKKGVYREFQGVRYNYWAKRGFYVSQRGGKQIMLHRALWEASNGPLPKARAVVPVNDDWENFEPGNWECRSHAGNGKPFEQIHPRIDFDGKRYYKAGDCPYYYHAFPYGATTRKTLLHRDVYTKFHGAIPEGYEVHHIDFDPSNNDSTNLVALHSKAHREVHRQAKYPSLRH